MLLSYWSADGDRSARFNPNYAAGRSFSQGPTGSNLSPCYTMLRHVTSDGAPTNVLGRYEQRRLWPAAVTESCGLTRGRPHPPTWTGPRALPVGAVLHDVAARDVRRCADKCSRPLRASTFRSATGVLRCDARATPPPYMDRPPGPPGGGVKSGGDAVISGGRCVSTGARR